ncbi:MAG: hypothetical protein PHP57_06595 [Sideroxydans sp.]|nr:hypothetical protein [Sideroxydans sp.]
MEEIIGVIWAVLNWRILLCVVSPLVVALGLSKILGFNTEPGIFFNLLLLGGYFGAFWQMRSEAGKKLTDSVEPTQISKPIAFIGLAFVGGMLGAIESSIFGSATLGALALVVVVALIALWYRIALRQEISLPHLVFLSVSLLVGFSALLLLNIFLR